MATDTQAPERASLLDVRHRVTVAEYRRMAEAGVLGPEPRVELLEGVLVEKMTKNPPHVIATDLIEDLLHRVVPAGFHVTMGNPLTIEESDSEPEPDAMVVRGQIRDYIGRRRTPADAALVIEVADTSYGLDRGQKWLTYAAAGVPVYWIVDLNRNRVEVHTEPAGIGEEARFAATRLYTGDERVPLVLDGREVARFAAREVLP